MATRFYFRNEGSFAPLTPLIDPGWEQTGQVVRVKLLRKTGLFALTTLADGAAKTVPITTTQDILATQAYTDPIPPQRITGTVSLVFRCGENAATNNVTLAVVVKVVSQDGGTLRGTLFSNFNNDTEFALTSAPATRIVNAQAITELTTQPGDRLVVELGGHAAAPTVAGSFLIRYGNSAASDFALTTALTTDLNPWIELSQDLFASDLNNFQSVGASSAWANDIQNIISVTERVR